MTPGISGVVVMISMLMLGALAIVRERERGTWEALLSTPVNASEAIIGKAIPYLLLGFVQAVFVIGCSRALFGLPLRGELIGLRRFPDHLYLRAFGDWSGHLRSGKKPTTGSTRRRAHLPSLNAAVGLPLSFLEHARVGSTSRRHISANVLYEGRSRGHAARSERILYLRPDPAGGYDRSRFDGGGNSRVSEAALVIEKAPAISSRALTPAARTIVARGYRITVCHQSLRGHLDQEGRTRSGLDVALFPNCGSPTLIQHPGKDDQSAKATTRTTGWTLSEIRSVDEW